MTHKILCPGKINLFLDVMGKTANGYHEILTLFLPVQGIEDTLTIEESDIINIKCNHPDVPETPANLCWKAAEAFASAAELTTRWNIQIEKHLPVAGGMGGGSSNAGRLLSLLQLNYPGRVKDKKLQEIALSIGADVPFFLNPVPSLASGVGEKLTPLKSANKLPIILISFTFPITAAWAYKNRKLNFNSSKLKETDIKTAWDKGNINKITYNDLGFAVSEKFPIIQCALDDLEKSGAGKAIVSGSGPTVLGVFNNINDRDHALEKLTDLGYPRENLIAATAG